MGAAAGGRVCVVGAGISGLVATKVLAEDGFEISLLEKRGSLGGVWSESRTYPGLRANNTRDTYSFSDFPYPASADEFPAAEQIRSYLESYADHFGLREHLRLATEVVSIDRAPAAGGADAPFEVRFRDARSGAGEESRQFDFIAICNGVFSTPRLPEFKERERFRGEVIHSSQFTDPELVAGKRVVVVGAGKSALDCARWSAQHARSCALVHRTPHWMLPRQLFGRLRIDKLFITRFAEIFLPYHHQSRVESLLHGPLHFIVDAFWSMQQRLLSSQVGMPGELRPEQGLPAGIDNAGVGGEAYEEVRRGRLKPVRGEISRFAGATTLELDSGEQLEADLIVCATGWHQETPFLAPTLRSAIERDGQFRLYRHIVPPEEPRIGFIGYASSFMCQLTAEVASHWLSQLFRGELTLPSHAEMDAEISRVLDWAEATYPTFGRGYFIGPLQVHYVDELMRDMGLPTRRTSNPFTEDLGLFTAERYRGLAAERRRAQAGP